jgi:hypothetical protein
VRLKPIGRLPRILALIQLAIWSAILGVASNVHSTTLPLVFLLLPATVLALSLRIRAWTSETAAVFRGFLITRTFQFDKVETFVYIDYQGIWSGGAPVGWCGLHQIDVELSNFRSSRSMPSTMCLRKDAIEIEHELNKKIELNRHSPSLGLE